MYGEPAERAVAKLNRDGRIYLEWNDDWRTKVYHLVTRVPNYKNVLSCSTGSGLRVIPWGSIEGSLEGGVRINEFPLVISKEEASAAPSSGPNGLGSATGAAGGAPTWAPAADGRVPTGTRHPDQTQAESQAAPTDLLGNMAQMVTNIMGSQREAMMEGFTALAETMGRTGPGNGKNGRVNSTIKVEPKMPWPEFGDRHKDPQEAEDFIRSFEAICQMANNGNGMRFEEMVYTLGNCLKGN